MAQDGQSSGNGSMVNPKIPKEFTLESAEWKKELMLLISEGQVRLNQLLSKCENLHATITSDSRKLQMVKVLLKTGDPICISEPLELKINLLMSIEGARMSFPCLMPIGRQQRARVANCLILFELVGC